MYGQPDLALSIEDTTQIAPCDGKVGTSFDGFQVACLCVEKGVWVWIGVKAKRRDESDKICNDKSKRHPELAVK
jgi:hypothetical protein